MVLSLPTQEPPGLQCRGLWRGAAHAGGGTGPRLGARDLDGLGRADRGRLWKRVSVHTCV